MVLSPAPIHARRLFQDSTYLPEPVPKSMGRPQRKNFSTDCVLARNAASKTRHRGSRDVPVRGPLSVTPAPCCRTNVSDVGVRCRFETANAFLRIFPIRPIDCDPLNAGRASSRCAMYSYGSHFLCNWVADSVFLHRCGTGPIGPESERSDRESERGEIDTLTLSIVAEAHADGTSTFRYPTGMEYVPTPIPTEGVTLPDDGSVDRTAGQKCPRSLGNAAAWRGLDPWHSTRRCSKEDTASSQFILRRYIPGEHRH
jgi:hypothetical protein